ncbi:TIGR04211 family SH3 domain-containing protein [Candidatus Thioglobus autotrophicus]|uniref:TIGR04211 family SH3 domain-containing protein n=1 Tax=Candidatus Thioglobus autotrophicus TaxID=1705394 RepID=UPI00299DFC8D|nr:TIGR04211 family SH3 domain-containing protein [Candidatus Thioglobus autotrophicus]WPE17154.1 TIGR04211 family SH3 domain-containing protein [Candidatus Thioglobus autotrophicus]
MRKNLLLVMLLTTGVVAETTVYVGDQVKIPMRANDAIAKDNVISHLNINTPVTLIKKQANGWSHIKHDDKKGFMISRYLTSKKPGNDLVKSLTIDLDREQKSNRKKYKAMQDLTQQIETHGAEISRLNIKILNSNTQSLELNKLQSKLFNLDETNTDLTQQVSILKAANGSLHTTDFLTIISAVTLFLGFGVGMGMSRVSGSRNNKMYTL